MKIVVILHLFYQDLWPEFKGYLQNIDVPFDLYITICKLHNTAIISQRILESFPNANILIVENRGADIGPFFTAFNRIIDSGKDYDYLLKIHTKKTLRKERQFPGWGTAWRKLCISPLVMTSAIVAKNIKLLEDPTVGIIGAKSQLNDASTNKSIMKWIREGSEFSNDMKIKFKLPDTEEKFFAGTMFWCKFYPLKKYISNYKLTHEYFQSGDHGMGNTAAHAGERFFCKPFMAEQLKVVGV